MMSKRLSGLFCSFFFFELFSSASLIDPTDLRKEAEMEYAAFRMQSIKEYFDFREKANAEYEDFLRQPWTEKELDLLFTPHKDPEPDPIPYIPEQDSIRSNPIQIDTVIPVPEIVPRPTPISPIEELPDKDDSKNVFLYGCSMSVRLSNLDSFELSGVSNQDMADGWRELNDLNLNNLLVDCIGIRNKHKLPDWCFFRLMDEVCGTCFAKGSNEHTLAMAYLLAQCGYKMRLMLTSSNKLQLLLGTKCIMFNRPGYKVDDVFYYAYDKNMREEGYISEVEFDGEKEFSLSIDEAPILGGEISYERKIDVKDYPAVTLSLGVNESLLKLYEDYPDGTLDSSPFSRWVIHGNTPVSKEVRNRLYPQIYESIKDMDCIQAVRFLLRVAQSFEYGYDDEIWGRDRAFWMEESWYYQKSDCEDHAIHFTHLVRDLLKLDAALIYYPGHLAAAVALPETVPGDYISYHGKKYTVCDPTYFYAEIGVTMPGMDNSSAVFIPLRN